MLVHRFYRHAKNLTFKYTTAALLALSWTETEIISNLQVKNKVNIGAPVTYQKPEEEWADQIQGRI